MASYRIGIHEMNLSMDALMELERVNDISSAEQFLKFYGSHVSSGYNHLGGVLCYSITLSSEKKVDKRHLEFIADNEMQAEASIGFLSIPELGRSHQSETSGNLITRFEMKAYGPSTFHPKLFEQILKSNRWSWRVINREISSHSLVPVWTIGAMQHPKFKASAEWLRKAWIRATQQSNVEFVIEERRRIQDMGRKQQSQMKIQNHQIMNHFKELEFFNLDSLEDDSWLLEWLKKIFKMVTAIDCQRTQALEPNKTDNPWVTYVSRQELMRRLLKGLTTNQKNYKEKFKGVYSLLLSILNNKRLEDMDHASYPLDNI